MTGAFLTDRDRLIGGMGRENRHRLAHPQHRHRLGLRGVFGRDALLLDHAIEHAVARRAGHAPDGDRAVGVSGDCGSATSSAASASDNRFGSLPK